MPPHAQEPNQTGDVDDVIEEATEIEPEPLDDEEAEILAEIEAEEARVKSTAAYRQFKAKWDTFARKCDDNDIMVREDFTCCNTCGNYEIRQEAKQADNEHYCAYIFYHGQEAARLYKKLMDGEKDIAVWLNWDYFVSVKGDDEDCMSLAAFLNEFAESAGCTLDYTSIEDKLILHVPIAWNALKKNVNMYN